MTDKIKGVTPLGEGLKSKNSSLDKNPTSLFLVFSVSLSSSISPKGNEKIRLKKTIIP